MPTRPKPACPVCRRLGCTVPEHQPKKRGVRYLPRPDYGSSEQRKRREAVVAAFLAEHGIRLANGDTIARCPQCHKMRAAFVADHVHPLALGGYEGGELAVHCRVCSGQQGAALTNSGRRGVGGKF